jgi:DNA polymerase III psi subunit
MQLAMWNAALANFKYVIAPSRLRAMAQKYTNNKSALVIRVLRCLDCNAAQKILEYICIAALEGGKALRIWVSVRDNDRPKWPGGGSMYLSLEEIQQQSYPFRPFCDNLDKERLRKYLAVMTEKDKMPTVKNNAIVMRVG